MRVIGIVLVRNEDLFIEWSIRNILEFCDEILIADHQSTDGTSKILQRLKAEFPEKLRYHSIKHPRESHQLIRHYAGSQSWIFGVDGDEIYDPAGLKKFREQLVAGKFSDMWAIFGNVLNVKTLDQENDTATGFLAPPCRSMTKLYNFSAIYDWSGNCLERLHGGNIAFRAGFSEAQRNDYHKATAWEESLFRCLHLCFLKRSTLDSADKPRLNIMDKYAWNVEKVVQKIAQFFNPKAPQNWKEEKYARGESSTVDISNFVSR
ncbi:MAG: glycosyltransferase family 2 protein [Chthoniobacterales bacterium]